MINHLNAQIIAHLCYHIDKVCRRELHNGNITGERDYVSNLGTHLRFPLGPFFMTRLAIARTFPQDLETIFGCDSIIIFKKGNIAKVGLFEAKWPRYFTHQDYAWDSLNRPGNSRFSSQIIRQRNWTNSGAVLWEMFFNESWPGTRNPPFDNFGSKCVLHRDASDYLNSNKLPISTLWNNNDLINVLPNSMNFRRIVYNILVCNFGKIFQIDNNSLEINSNDKGYRFEVPVYSIQSLDNQFDDTQIQSFMKETGLDNYVCIEINEF